jgi:hypothetical protein
MRDKIRLPHQRAPLRIAACAALLLICQWVSISRAVAAVPQGVWLMREKTAIQVFDCNGMLCGRVVWLRAPLDPQGILKHDSLNPDPALRQRQVCGPTIIWDAHPIDSSHWNDGWFYNPDDGATYRVTMEMQSADVMVARIYLGVPLFGTTRTLVRVPMGVGAGWC